MSGVSVVGQPQGWQTPGAGVDGLGEGAGGGPGKRPGKSGDAASGHARLVHADLPWIRAAGDAEALYTHLGPVRSDMEKAHEGLSASEAAGDFAVLGELAVVRESWLRRVSTAQGECGSLTGKLRAVAREQGATEQAVRDDFGPSTGVPAQSSPLPSFLAQVSPASPVPPTPPAQLSSLYLLGGGDAGGSGR